MRVKKTIGAIIISLFILTNTFAADNPHSTHSAVIPVDCMEYCHQMHASQGTGLTKDASNAVLCLSCHISTKTGMDKYMTEADDAAVPGVKGRSHRWDGMMPATSDPNNQYGLRATDDLENVSLQSMLRTGMFNDKVTCSVCHQQHSQKYLPWDPRCTNAEGTATGGDTITITDSTQSWDTDEWIGVYVRMSDRKFGRSSTARTKKIVDSTPTSLTIDNADPLPVIVESGDEFVIQVRKFQRLDFDLTGDPASINDLCEDCHYYRSQKAIEDGVVTGHNNHDGNMKSHPLFKIFTSEDGETPTVGEAGEFTSAPYEPQHKLWGKATGSRYDKDGGACANPTYTDKTSCEGASFIWLTDDNRLNNIVLDLDKQLRCLSCHGVHYTDSDAYTIDGPALLE